MIDYEDDDADVGTIKIPANGQLVINLSIGQGLRGPTTVLGTHVASGDSI